MTPRDVLAALAVAALWGFNFPAIKSAVEAFPPLFMSGLRFSAVFLVLVWICPIPRGHFKAIAVLSVGFGFLHFGVLAIAMTNVDAAAGAIVMQLNVPFAAFLASVFLSDPFGWRRWAGLAVALVGVMVLAGEPQASQAPWYLFLVGVSAFGWAIGQVLVKKAPGVSSLSMNAWVSGLLAPQLLALSFLVEDGQLAAVASAAWSGWLGLAYQVVGASLLAYGVWYSLLKKHAVSRVAPFNLLVPVFGVMGGVVLLGEALTMEKLIGGLITLGGVALIQLSVRNAKVS